MVNECETECFANYDVDVIFNPSTIEESVKLIMDGKADVVYPLVMARWINAVCGSLQKKVLSL